VGEYIVQFCNELLHSIELFQHDYEILIYNAYSYIIRLSFNDLEEDNSTVLVESHLQEVWLLFFTFDCSRLKHTVS
jgi:hypothetical protein